MLSTAPEAVGRYWETRSAIASASATERASMLTEKATEIRRSIVTMIAGAGLGHIGGDLSVTDLVTALHFAVMNIFPDQPSHPDRDRFILSKGHCAAALYSTLAACGFFDSKELSTFMAPLSMLNGHPNRRKVPGIETNTGPLGHGFPVAVGCAIGARLVGCESRTYVIMGDGEMQEGSNWEAAMCASHQKLANLTAFVDRNRLQQGAGTEETNALEPLAGKWSAFGWEVRVIDGHDFDQILGACEPSTSGKPVAVIANTIKGKGVSFIENRVEWHHKVPSSEQVGLALAELTK